MKFTLLLSIIFLYNTVVARPVNITKGIMKVAGISRNQDNRNKIHERFAFSSRPCPPFCLQPTNPFRPYLIDVVGEIEIIYLVQKILAGDENNLLIDVREEKQRKLVAGGAIPNSVNIVFNLLDKKAIDKNFNAVIDLIVNKFDVTNNDNVLSFNNVKTLYFFCDGQWDPRASTVINSLLSIGYPEDKIKYYRGGLNDWHSVGLTVING